MNKISLLNLSNNVVLDSRIVSEMLGKRHTDLMRDIEQYINYICQNADLRYDDFFIKSTYKAGTGKSYNNYQITKKGCEFLAHKLTGQKGAIFTAKYINAFDKLQTSKNDNISNNQIIQMLVQSQNNMLSMIQALNAKIELIQQIKDTKTTQKSNKTKKKLLIQTLPQSTIKLIDTMLLSKTYTYKEISIYLKSMGYNIGKYALSRYNKEVLRG